MNQINSVCVYSASSTKIDAVYFQAAEALGRLLAGHRIRLINGAGNLGLMRSVADAVLKSGGEVTGVIPHFMVEQNWHHTGLTELIEVESMHERKQKMANLSDGIIALPGGCGTLEELLEIITWKQLGLYLNPIIVLNVNGFFDPLLEMFEKAIEENFMRQQHRDIWKVARTPEEAVELLYETPVWDVSIRKFAAI
ncbi:TIGR00730 family Rossman fold protein [Bacteroides acidifaciens]|nr:TIGR00730 family Rossman fold protein [Bacteroides acidifaciens]MBF0731384.1 TIGR00730 family Rossman fold protein [Bacteroides acidifaciens]MBF0837464.1 TIGR00730 family Rossman fold protein [Bacteroides acidifaciens]MCR1999775.1 TIGR00730 family Rossman fold protein [Bacteroides acidifaciens]MCR2004576.1 TIGR00730 family Rossman fold protein [Bacteroides acidifaciens]NDO52893.1 TIGR00730 family Rossman fold protein [Bacteroides acidifaciens]